ncbi:MAG: hypothetical protein AAGJ32_05395 [Pseudomonadota bacterium]
MFKSLLGKPKNASVPDGSTPDISRVVPGYDQGTARVVPKASLSQDTAQPAQADEASPDQQPLSAESDNPDAPLLLGERDRIDPPKIDEGEADGKPVLTALTGEPSEEKVTSEAWLKTDLEALRNSASTLLSDLGSDAKKRALFLVSHNMRGAAGAYGYPVIERITSSLCLLLEQSTEISTAAPLVNLHVEACRAAVNTNDSKASADLSDAVCTALEDQVSARLTGWG